MILFSIGVLILHASIIGKIEISTPKLCTFDTFSGANAFSSLVSPIILIHFMTLNLVLLLIDLTLYIREKGCKIRSFFCSDDPYGFRIEFLVSSILMIVCVLSLSYSMIFYLIGLSRGVRSITWMVVSIIHALFEIVVAFTFTGFGLLFGLINKCSNAFRKKKYDSEFEAFINTKGGKEIFKLYARNEYSLENILFFEEVQNYKKLDNLKVAKRKSQELLQNYLSIGSLLEVNLSHPVRKLTTEKIENFQDYEDEYQFIFDDCILETKRNMRDTFSRISSSNEFLQWKETTKNLVETSNETKVENNKFHLKDLENFRFFYFSTLNTQSFIIRIVDIK